LISSENALAKGERALDEYARPSEMVGRSLQLG